MFSDFGLRLFTRFMKLPNGRPVLDPISTLIRIGLYTQHPAGTKIGFCNNSLRFDSPSVYQGVIRSMTGSSREDLSVLAPCLVKVCEWYEGKRDDDVQFLVERAIRGLEALFECYKTNSHGSSGLLLNTIQLYINMLRHPAENKVSVVGDAAVIPDSFKDVWSPEEISLLCQMIRHMDKYQRTDKESVCMQMCIEEFLTGKDMRVHDLLAFGQ